jgi:hypothetical protein
MATGAINGEIYSLSDARTGAILVSRLVLTGWGTAASTLATWTDKGRLWGVFDSATNDFSLRRRPPGVYAGTDEVCSGTVSGGKVTLSADNSSGITGSADVDDGTPGTNPTEDSTFDVIVSYADENDLIVALDGASSFLDSNSKYQAQDVRFERLLKDAKRKLDSWLFKAYEHRLRYDDYGRPLLAHISNVGDLARCHALIAAYMAQLSRAGQDEVFRTHALSLLKDAEREFEETHILFDYERDRSTDAQDLGVNRVHRA